MFYINKMSKMYKCFLSIVFLAGLCGLLGCTNSGRLYQFQDENKIHVVTTIYPIQDFAMQVAGEQAEIINLVPAGMEPHDFELSVMQMQLLEDADIFVYNGAGMEPFVEKTVESLTNKDLIIVEAAKDVPLLQETHSHEHEEGHGKEHDSDEGNYDPHTWLGIENAKMEVEAIRDAFCKFDASNADLYTDNAEAYNEKLEELKQKYHNELQDVATRQIVVAHEAFGYLCKENELTQEAIEGLTADSEPDSARMKEIIDFCNQNKIKVIFFEELVSPKVANAIATEVGAKTDVLNPIEGRTAEQEEQGLTYIDLMESNLESLKKALK